MVADSAYSHNFETRIARLYKQIQVERDSDKVIELAEQLNRPLESRENELARGRRGEQV